MKHLDLLRESSLFSDCLEENLIQLCGIAGEREFGDGDLLFTLGDEARDLMVVASGQVQLEFPVSVLGEVKNISFEIMGRGDVIGWSTLVLPNRFTLNARANGPTRVASFAREELNSLFEDEPRFGFRVMRKLVTIVRLRLERTHTMWRHEIQQSLDERFR